MGRRGDDFQLALALAHAEKLMGKIRLEVDWALSQHSASEWLNALKKIKSVLRDGKEVGDAVPGPAGSVPHVHGD